MPLDQPTPSGFEKQMSFLQHAEELRWHLIRSAIALVLITIALLVYIEEIIRYVVLGPISPSFPTHRLLCYIDDKLCFGELKMHLQATEPSEQFTRAILTAFVGALVLAFPYLSWELWRFAKPGLYVGEIKNLRGIVLATSLLFLTGVSFGYFVVSPFTLGFFATFSLDPRIENIWTIGSVIGLVVQICLAAGMLFELPILAYFAAKIGIVSAPFLRHYRKHAVVACLVVAGVLTPSPDALSQLLLAGPLYILFEISIGIVARVERRRAQVLEAQASV